MAGIFFPPEWADVRCLLCARLLGPERVFDFPQGVSCGLLGRRQTLPWPLGPLGVNGVTFLVPQELNASRPATPKMDSVRMTMFAGNGVALLT